MKRVAPTLIVVLSVLAAIVPMHLVAQWDTPKTKPDWEFIYFRSIDSLSIKAGWTPLRELSLPPDSFEVRVWIGFGIGPLEGVSIRRDRSTWSGRHVVEQRGQSISADVRFVIPKSQWNDLWARLVQLGLLTLPDSSQLRDEVIVADGVSYVVEINKDGRYRTYMYGNPKHQKWPEAKQVLQIAQILEHELLSKR